jgi:Transposase DDE domain
MELETLIKSIEESEVSTLLESFFDNNWLDEQSRNTHFIERNRSGLSGRMFLIMNVLELSNHPQNSLQDQCTWLEENFDVHLKKQSLDERYNTFSVLFLKTCFNTLLSQWIVKQKPENLTTCFNRILIRDSTTWQLPASMSAFYPSKSVSKTGSSIKLDYCFNYLDGKTEQLIIESGRIPDSKINTQHEPEFKPNDLVVKDLGYWNCKQMDSYNDHQVYFVSRLKSDASLYQKKNNTYEQINLENFLPDDEQIHSYHWLLSKQKTPVRVCIEKVPEWVRLQRLEALEKLAKSQKWNLSSSRIKLCGYNLYVTNTSEAQLPESLVRLIYAIRWQIEIVFKIWKSIFDLDNFKPMSIFRFECMLYGRLMLILINNQLQALFKSIVAHIPDYELSEFKAAKELKKKIDTLITKLTTQIGQIKDWIIALFDKWFKFSKKEQKKKNHKPLKISTLQTIKSLA